MNYGASWYEFNFAKVYPKMTVDKVVELVNEYRNGGAN